MIPLPCMKICGLNLKRWTQFCSKLETELCMYLCWNYLCQSPHFHILMHSRETYLYIVYSELKAISPKIGVVRFMQIRCEYMVLQCYVPYGRIAQYILPSVTIVSQLCMYVDLYFRIIVKGVFILINWFIFFCFFPIFSFIFINIYLHRYVYRT